MFPIINHFRATSYYKSFILNALVTALITIVAIEMRIQLNNEKGQIYNYFNEFFDGKTLDYFEIISIMFITTFIAAICVYNIMYLICNFGGGFIISTNNVSYF
jgi:hypothetical protein